MERNVCVLSLIILFEAFKLSEVQFKGHKKTLIFKSHHNCETFGSIQEIKPKISENYMSVYGNDPKPHSHLKFSEHENSEAKNKHIKFQLNISTENQKFPW